MVSFNFPWKKRPVRESAELGKREAADFYNWGRELVLTECLATGKAIHAEAKPQSKQMVLDYGTNKATFDYPGLNRQPLIDIHH